MADSPNDIAAKLGKLFTKKELDDLKAELDRIALDPPKPGLIR